MQVQKGIAGSRLQISVRYKDRKQMLPVPLSNLIARSVKTRVPTPGTFPMRMRTRSLLPGGLLAPCEDRSHDKLSEFPLRDLQLGQHDPSELLLMRGQRHELLHTPDLFLKYPLLFSE